MWPMGAKNFSPSKKFSLPRSNIYYTQTTPGGPMEVSSL